MYEVRYWHDGVDEFQTTFSSINFMNQSQAKKHAQKESCESQFSLVAVVEDGQSIPHSIFLNGREFAKVEIDD